MFLIMLSSCQKDLTLNTPLSTSALKKQKSANEVVSIVKKESFSNDVFKTTYSNGIELYTFPSNKPGHSEALTPLSCAATPVNSEGITANGCACLHFNGFGTTATPLGSVSGFYFDENKYYAFDASTKPHDYKFYLKIVVNINPELDPTVGSLWYENYLPWEEPENPSCTRNVSMVVVWPNQYYNWCEGYLNVTAKKVFKRLDIFENWTTAVGTEDLFPDSGYSPCAQ